MRLKKQIRLVNQVNDLTQTHKIDGAMNAIKRIFGELKLMHQEISQMI